MRAYIVLQLYDLLFSVYVGRRQQEEHGVSWSAASDRYKRQSVGWVDDNGASNAHIWGMTNPPDMDTFWEQYLSEPPDNAECFFQPSGLSQEADWLEFLPEGYYENLAEGKSEDWVDVYINAQFGKSLSGQPLFRAFDRDIHVAEKELNFKKFSTKPVVIGMGFCLFF